MDAIGSSTKLMWFFVFIYSFISYSIIDFVGNYMVLQKV